MTSLTIASTTNLQASVARHAASLKAALRRAFSLVDGRGTARPQSKYIAGVKKSILSSERCKAIELVLACVIDLARRGSLEDATAIGEHITAIARAEWAAMHHGADRPLSRAEAHIAEQKAQGEKENAEVAMTNFPSISTMLRFLAADAAYERAARDLRMAVQREVVTA